MVEQKRAELAQLMQQLKANLEQARKVRREIQELEARIAALLGQEKKRR